MSIEVSVEKNGALSNLIGKIAFVPIIDRTLTKSGRAADAKATGDELKNVNLRVDNIDPHFAKNVGYDNSSSGLESEDVQSAIDEVRSIAVEENKEILDDIEELRMDYRTVDGVTEWINPLMEAGVEYRTTERFMGNPVYTKLIKHLSTSPISPGSSASCLYKIDDVIDGLDYLVRCSGAIKYIHSSPYSVPIPYSNKYNGECISVKQVDDTGVTLVIYNYTIAGNCPIFIQLWYTKSES